MSLNKYFIITFFIFWLLRLDLDRLVIIFRIEIKAWFFLFLFNFDWSKLFFFGILSQDFVLLESGRKILVAIERKLTFWNLRLSRLLYFDLLRCCWNNLFLLLFVLFLLLFQPQALDFVNWRIKARFAFREKRLCTKLVNTYSLT